MAGETAAAVSFGVHPKVRTVSGVLMFPPKPVPKGGILRTLSRELASGDRTLSSARDYLEKNPAKLRREV
jgi:hypothetical protein